MTTINQDYFDRHYQEMWRFETARLVVLGYAGQEDLDPVGAFDDDGETARDIQEGRVEWFCASVIVCNRDGDVLGRDHLGGCAYENASDFFKAEKRGYFGDMVRVAVAEARVEIARRCALNGG